MAKSVEVADVVSGLEAVICRVEAGLGNWDAAVKAGIKALNIASRIEEYELRVASRLALGEAYMRMARWYDGEKKGEKPPLSREEAIEKAQGHAKEAKDLAEAKGMKGYVKKADELLAEIDGQAGR